MNKNLILSNEEYANLPESIKFKVPYIYSFKNEGRFLFYFGGKHMMDPTHPQFDILKEQWTSFRNTIEGEKAIVIYEGNVFEKDLTTMDESIKRFGESGAIVFLANQAGIPSFRPEPTIEYEANELLKEFSREDIYYFYMIRGIVSWQRKIEPESFDEFIVKNTKRYKDSLPWEGFDFSFTPLIPQIHKRIFNKEFSLNDKDFLRKIVDSSYHESYISKIAEKSLHIRDLFILDNISKYWEDGYNIFVVYGSAHAKIQERVLREMVEKKGG